MTDWLSIYRVAVALLVASYAVRTTLFLLLRPESAFEWATTAVSAATLVFFATLLYWMTWDFRGPPPVIYPPLVFAAAACGLTSVIFSVFALRQWLQRRGL
jgi:hypothetical protein